MGRTGKLACLAALGLLACTGPGDGAGGQDGGGSSDAGADASLPGRDVLQDFRFQPGDDLPEVRSTDGAPGPDTRGPGPDTLGPATSVSAVQEASESQTCGIPFASQLVATDLSFQALVVTAKPFPWQTGGIAYDGFYVEDPGGGAWHGAMVAFAAAAMPALEPGMEVDLVADHKEVKCLTVLWASSVQIVAQDGAPYGPVITTPQALTGADAESLEGVFVEIGDVTVTDANPDADEGADNGVFEVDGILRVGNDYQLPYMSPGTDSRDVGDQFDWIRGVMTWRNGAWVLMPRKPGDMMEKGGTVTPDQGPGEDVVTGPDTWTPPPDTWTPPPDTWTPPPDTWTPPPDTWTPPPDTVEPGEIVIPPEPDSELVITEILYDPSHGVPDDKGEWFEIHNTTGDPVDLNGYRIGDGGGNLHIIQNGGPLLLAPGGYFIFGVSFYESENGGVEVDYLLPYAMVQLDNGEDEIILMNQFGVELDRVEYREAQGWPEAVGASLSLIHPNLDNNVAGHWALATTTWGDTLNLGTPGAANVTTP